MMLFAFMSHSPQDLIIGAQKDWVRDMRAMKHIERNGVWVTIPRIKW